MKTITHYQEYNLENALLGFALSYYDGSIDLDEWWTQERRDKALQNVKKRAFNQGGHNKVLESIVVSFLIKSPRSLWQEFDTYRAGMTKNSASTMHTLKKRLLTRDDFTDNTTDAAIENINKLIAEKSDIAILKENLPEGFLQVRQITTNYKVLQNMYFQRKDHRYTQWQNIFNELIPLLEHPYFIIPVSEEIEGAKDDK